MSAGTKSSIAAQKAKRNVPAMMIMKHRLQVMCTHLANYKSYLLVEALLVIHKSNICAPFRHATISEPKSSETCHVNVVPARRTCVLTAKDKRHFIILLEDGLNAG